MVEGLDDLGFLNEMFKQCDTSESGVSKGYAHSCRDIFYNPHEHLSSCYMLFCTFPLLHLLQFSI